MSQVGVFAERDNGFSAAVAGEHYKKLQRRLEKPGAIRGELRRAAGHISGPLVAGPFSVRLLLDPIQDYVTSRAISRPLKSR